MLQRRYHYKQENAVRSPYYFSTSRQLKLCLASTVFNYSSLILKLTSHIFCNTNSSQLFTCDLLIIICRPVSITLSCLYIFFPLSHHFFFCVSVNTLERLQFYQSIVYCKRSAIDGLIKRSSSRKMCMSHWSFFCVFWFIIFHPATDIQYFPSLNPLSINNWVLPVKHWMIYVSLSEKVSF